ncbi:glycerophosphodiester phosphodiesterase [Glaciimonas soli]|uniref:Glycerophosphodiester phosphodiesterase n=1 Tax=Glaciimonas soli TaxID=2590999 RepID=A0A843YT66_9BURK|nr:glycerophosphodiester phosphodiesterase [Glaciimonas soli]MQR01187.1 glycerophosphodiester phosphodiesterase [Glaciimonas soli]
MWPYPKFVAHRGGGILAPENTLAGLRCGWSYGYHAVEFDVMLSSDGVPMLMHDPILGRTVRGVGKINEYTAAQLKAMDAGAWFGAEFVGEPICTYQQAMEFCRQHGIWMNVEIKPVEGFEIETGHVVAQETLAFFSAEIAAHIERPDATTFANLPLFSSFSIDALRAAQVAAAAIPRGYLVDDIADEGWSNLKPKLEELDAITLHTNHKHLSPAQVDAIKQAGYGLFCYTVNTLERGSEIQRWGVDGFCTDRIDLFKENNKIM